MRYLACLVFFLVCISAASAQEGSLAGIVKQQGTALPGVTISATNQATGFTSTSVTDATGRFRIPNLAPGKYKIDAALSGFESHTLTAEVGVGQSRFIEIDFGPEPVSKPATGAVSGSVSSGGAGVDGAALDFAPDGDGDHASATSGSDGRYTRDYLTPGPYAVTCSATGFMSSTKHVTVEKEKTAPLDFTLEKVK